MTCSFLGVLVRRFQTGWPGGRRNIRGDYYLDTLARRLMVKVCSGKCCERSCAKVMTTVYPGQLADKK